MRYKRAFFVALALGAVALSIYQNEAQFVNMYSFVNPVDLLVLY